MEQATSTINKVFVQTRPGCQVEGFGECGASPEESLIQMPRSYRENVDHVVLLLLWLLWLSSTCKTSERHN